MREPRGHTFLLRNHSEYVSPSYGKVFQLIQFFIQFDRFTLAKLIQWTGFLSHHAPFEKKRFGNNLFPQISALMFQRLIGRFFWSS